MLAAATAVFLAASLILETAFCEVALGRALAVAGLVFLVLAILAPSWPRTRPRHDRRCSVSLHQHIPHPHIAHRREHGPVKVADVRPSGNPVARFNTRAAVVVTRVVGTMYCAYAFCLLAFYGLPAALKGGAPFVQWASSQFIQLVLLPVILVGSGVLAEASDRMAKRQFDDVEVILHQQDQTVQHLAAQDEKILAILERIDANTALTQEVRAAIAQGAAPVVSMPAPPAAPPAKRLATKAERGKESGSVRLAIAVAAVSGRCSVRRRHGAERWYREYLTRGTAADGS